MLYYVMLYYIIIFCHTPLWGRGTRLERRPIAAAVALWRCRLCRGSPAPGATQAAKSNATGAAAASLPGAPFLVPVPQGEPLL